MQKGDRPDELPDSAPTEIKQLMTKCWDPIPKSRPAFKDIITEIENIASGRSVRLLRDNEDAQATAIPVTGRQRSNSFQSYQSVGHSLPVCRKPMITNETGGE